MQVNRVPDQSALAVKRLLASTIEVLLRVGCQFWDCPGPDGPFEDMRTCYVCSQVQALREALERQ